MYDYTERSLCANRRRVYREEYAERIIEFACWFGLALLIGALA